MRWATFFLIDERHSSFGEGRRRETLPVNPLTPSSNKEAQSNDEVFCEIDNYFDEVEKGEPVKVGDSPQYVLSSHAWLGVSSSGGIGPSTSRAPLVNSNAQYACED